ncbi:hypothetical protein MKW98_032352 [Papaver atlanticum]|uniref:Phytocyanin domain-containing protein n=1 Tax=Papaver atlanticum TaxID=357466 RepID=A0AAD4SF11_9MAGN|nr:hypothetical protein MKW98_032352 [Papaver atlanticum]
MGLNTKFLFSLLLLVVAVPLMGNAFVWNVGDDAGWSGQSQFNYTGWALVPTFLVGDDSLRFVYDPNITNVLEVTYCDFKSLGTTVPITKAGHQYFISGNPVDCRNGLKVDILSYDSPYLRFWRLGGPPVDANGYGKIPDFEDTPTEGANTTEDMSCDSDSSTAAWTPAMSPTST